MGQIDPLALDFLSRHPADSARILEELPVETVCSLIRSIKPELAADIIECMMTSYGCNCIMALDKQTAVSLMQHMNTVHAARILRAADGQRAKELTEALPAHVKDNIHSALKYPEQTIGRIMDAKPFSLPESMTVNNALKRIKELRGQAIYEIFVVDNDHRLKGGINVADLLSAAKSSSLGAITAAVPFLATRTTLRSAALHIGWQTYSELPVVGRDHILSGVLKSSTLMHILAETRETDTSSGVMEEIFSITRLYWIVMTDLITSIAGNVTDNRRRNG